MPCKVRHVVASLDDEASGPTYSVGALSSALLRNGVDSAVMAIGRRGPSEFISIFSHDFARFPLANRLMFSHSLWRALDASAQHGAILHGHGLWLAPNIYPAQVARLNNVPLIMSPRGMLGREALAFSANKKKLMWMLYQGRAMRSATCFHATSEAEAEDIRRAGLKSPIAVIPNGIDVRDQEPARHERTVLHLGRLHPKKGVDRLVAAWAQVAALHTEWRLLIVGPSELGYRDFLEAQVRELGVARVDFEGPLFGAAKWRAYERAGLFVLPTLNENFGMVVAEALASGVPVICTKGAPWKGLEEEKCGWWVDHGSDNLAVALNTALSMNDATRSQMGGRGRAWMARDFGWDGIAARMAEVYAWCLGKGDQPDCVVLD